MTGIHWFCDDPTLYSLFRPWGDLHETNISKPSVTRRSSNKDSQQMRCRIKSYLTAGRRRLHLQTWWVMKPGNLGWKGHAFFKEKHPLFHLGSIRPRKIAILQWNKRRRPIRGLGPPSLSGGRPSKGRGREGRYTRGRRRFRRRRPKMGEEDNRWTATRRRETPRR